MWLTYLLVGCEEIWWSYGLAAIEHVVQHWQSSWWCAVRHGGAVARACSPQSNNSKKFICDITKFNATTLFPRPPRAIERRVTYRRWNGVRPSFKSVNSMAGVPS